MILVLSAFPMMGVFQVHDGSVPRFAGLSVMPVLPVIAMILELPVFAVTESYQ